MKLCIIVPWITQSRGGTENVGQAMANAMAARGHDVHLLTFDPERRPSRWPLDAGIGLHHVTALEPRGQDDELLLQLASIGPDLVVGLHMNRTFGQYVRAAHKLGVPLVLSEHIDPRFPQRIGSFTRDERWTAFQGAARIHLLVEAFRDSLPGHMQDRIRVIPNTVPEAAQVADPAGGAEDGGRRVLITVARLVPRKNLRQLVQEFAAVAPDHPDWELRFVGDGPLRGPLEDLARQQGIAGQVHFTGELEDVYSELARAQAFVLPSLFEGFPMSSLEAMAHGLPVVGYGLCNGLNVQVTHEETGLLVARPSEAGGLGAALARLMGDGALRTRLGAAALARFRARYAGPVITDLWERLFLEALATGAPQRPPLETRLAAALDRMVHAETN